VKGAKEQVRASNLCSDGRCLPRPIGAGAKEAKRRSADELPLGVKGVVDGGVGGKEPLGRLSGFKLLLLELASTGDSVVKSQRLPWGFWHFGSAPRFHAGFSFNLERCFAILTDSERFSSSSAAMEPRKVDHSSVFLRSTDEFSVTQEHWAFAP